MTWGEATRRRTEEKRDDWTEWPAENPIGTMQLDIARQLTKSLENMEKRALEAVLSTQHSTVVGRTTEWNNASRNRSRKNGLRNHNQANWTGNDITGRGKRSSCSNWDENHFLLFNAHDAGAMTTCIVVRRRLGSKWKAPDSPCTHFIYALPQFTIAGILRLI